MNNSKKLKAKKVKEVKLSEKPITSVSKPWLITSLVLVVLLIGAVLFDQLYTPTLMKIDGKNYHLKDVSYYLYSVESTYDYYNQMLGGSYWDMTADKDKGTTMRDEARQEAIDQILRYEIVYNEAVDQGYQLTDDEKKTISTNVDSLLSGQMKKTVIDKNNFTKANLTKILNKMTLSERYKNDQIAKLNIDKDKIKEGIKYEDYRQYNIEYIFISTQTTDADGNAVDLSEDEINAAYDKIKGVYDKALTTDDWSTLVPKDDPDLTYKEDNFTENGSTFSANFRSTMKRLENGDISYIFKDTDGYYVVRMIDNKATEAYDNAVDSAIKDAEESAFTDYFDKTIKPKHKYTLNNKALNSLKMGTVTLA